MQKVILTDPIDGVCPEMLNAAGIEVRLPDPAKPEAWKDELSDVDGWIIRSGTRITAELMSRAVNLKVIGRAGVGVDNVDLESATRKGILVLNAPDGNTISTAEHTCAMILSLARNIPQADQSLEEGRWDRKSFKGTELYHKTIGVVGLGKIGMAVAHRMQSFGMTVVGVDPVVSAAAAEKLGIEMVSYSELLERADVITFHVPLVPDTANMLDRAALARCKKGVRIVNCARGGLIDEAALLEALKSGRVAGAALDVYSAEPPHEKLGELVKHPRVVTTPHIAASTAEAQRRVAEQVTVELIRALKGEPVGTAVNSVAIRQAANPEVQPYIDLARRLGSLLSQLTGEALDSAEVRYHGEWLSTYREILTVAALRGLMSRWRHDQVNLINARVLAEEAGLTVAEQLLPPDRSFKNLVEIVGSAGGRTRSISGVVFGNNRPRIIRIDEYDFDFQPAGHILFYRNQDRPGMLAAVGRVLADAGLNIGSLVLGRKEKGAMALTAVSTDEPVPDDVLKEVAALEGIEQIRAVYLD
ncbi:MAG TPA: phosphoglycerate dehydrogenase [Rhodothermales bacterium]|nr:phosphoglycerate dehydrogenase [Rhodothermales bacterium]